MFFFNSTGSSGKKMPALLVCVTEGKSGAWGRPVALSPVRRYCKITHLWQPSCTSAVPGASVSPAHCWVLFPGPEQGAAPWEVLWGVCVFQRELLGWWHHQVPRGDVEQHPLWLLHVPGGRSHLPGSWVCQSGVCQGEKGFFSQGLGFYFFPSLFLVSQLEALEELALVLCNPLKNISQRRANLEFPMQVCTVGFHCEANPVNLTWIPSHTVSACCSGGSDTQGIQWWSLDLPGAEHGENVQVRDG